MNAPSVTHAPDMGVYYSLDDVAGLIRRLFVVAIDLTIVLVLCVPLFLLDSAAIIPTDWAAAGAFLLAWSYFAGLKATTIPTLGYRLAKVQLVDLRGGPAGLWRCTVRFLFFFLTLGNTVDLLLLSHDPNRQTLRDKFAGTYVIRRGARPIGSGPITYPTYFVGTLSCVFPEVARSVASQPRAL